MKILRVALIFFGVILYVLLSFLVASYDQDNAWREPYKSYASQAGNYFLRENKNLTIGFFGGYLVVVLAIFKQEAWAVLGRISVLFGLVILLVLGIVGTVFLLAS